MRLTYKKTLTVLLVFFSSLSLFAQNNFFSKAVEGSIEVGNAKRVLTPERYNLVETTPQNLKNFLWSLPDEKEVMNRSLAPVMELPMPGGSSARFRVWKSSIQEAGLEAKFPEIQTFAGQGVDDPYATVRMDYSPYFGFHAQILSRSGRVYVDPYARGNIQYYQSYYQLDNKRVDPFSCSSTDEPVETVGGVANKIQAGPCRGTQLYTYRLAVSNTGEYAVAVGAAGNAGALHSAIVTTVNRVDGVYESELAVRLILVANNNVIEYLDASSDPFTGNNNGNTLLGESQTVITNNIGTPNFDIGHTFSTGGGGIAGLGVVCNASNKARGITGSGAPFGDGYDIDYVAHEMGHQFGATHTFNSTMGSCGGGNRTSSTAYEVGSGTTIMGYAGICNSDNIQAHSDPFFHAVSFDQISIFLETGATCHGTISTGNNIPQITAMDNNNVTIPVNTPFTLTGSATDADGDALSYNWEQWDLGSSGTWNSGAGSTNAPLFKSRVPKSTGSRTFPDMNVILAGYPANPAAAMGGLRGETLPTVARTMKFKLTVRDNRAGGGGVASGGDGCQAAFAPIFAINVAGITPFAVVLPNGGESFPGASVQTITWNNAGTNAAPFNTPNVKITLSTDGGFTYPIVIAASTPNDGSEALSIPTVITNAARIRIEGVNNVFFDISDNNFAITTPINCTSPAVVTQDPVSTAVCATGTATFTAAGTSADPVLYQWQSSVNGLIWNNITDDGIYIGTNNATLTINNSPDSINSFRYRALLFTSPCPNKVATNTVTQAVLTVMPKPAIAVTSSLSSVVPGQTAVLTATVSNMTGVTYQWFLNDAAIAGANSNTYEVTFGNTGTYSVQATAPAAQGSCVSSKATVTVNANSSNQLYIFPSPNDGKFKIAYYHSGATTTRNVSVYAASGALVYQKEETVTAGYKVLDVNIPASAAGIYLVVLRNKDGKEIATGKVLVGTH